MSLLTRSLSALLPGFMFPWSSESSALQALVYKDIYGGDDAEVVTRDTAMRVAPVKRARAVIVGRLADLPLELGEFVNGEFVADATQPAWLTTTASLATTPWWRAAWTLDDLLFHGWSLWAIERDAVGNVIDADRIEQQRWRFNAESPTGVQIGVGTDAAVLVWHNVTDPRSVALFAGPDEGLLVTGRDAITGWRHMERAWVGRVRNPIPLIVIHEKEANGATEAEAKDAVSAFAKARTAPNGAVGYLSSKFALEVHGEAKADLFNEGRNAARIDIANHVNLPVSYLDGSTATASLTYVTQEGDRQGLVDDLEYWIAPYEAALSKEPFTGDARKVIRVNRSNLTAAPNDAHGPETSDKPAPATPEATE
jgi:hypothetical protein